MPITLSFFYDLDANSHEGPSLDGESEFVLIFKFFLHSGSENKFFEVFYKNAYNFVLLLIWMKNPIEAYLQMENQNLYQFFTVGQKINFAQ